MNARNLLVSALLFASTPALAAPPASVDVDAFIRKDVFNNIEISPDGQYFAATVPREDRTILVILRRSDNTITASVDDGKDSHVAGVTWVSPKRLLVSMGYKFGSLDQPSGTGELYGIDVDGSRAGVLVGYSAKSKMALSSHRKSQSVVASLVDDLKGDDENVIISTRPFIRNAVSTAERMNVRSGHRNTLVAASPVENASFATDLNGVIRFSAGEAPDRNRKLYYRDGEGAQWKLVNDEAVTGLVMDFVGFSADNKIAYLQVEQPTGPDAILAYDTATSEKKQVMRDDDSDPAGAIFDANGAVVGFNFYDGRWRSQFLDDASPEARLRRGLEKAFGKPVIVTSRTDDGRLLLLQAWSDLDPGSFYVYDTTTNKAEPVVARGSWLDKAKLAPMEPITVKARDGMVLHGYLSRPQGSDGKNLPMVVMPHGGPFQIRDTWGYNPDVQMLAQAGYAVLQLNFRGSPGYGDAYHKAGARQWGLAMQDDLTDATRWAISEGIADPARICISGASYGAYASLMGVAKEPDLYKCAIGYVGIYDLPMMHAKGDIRWSASGRGYLEDWLGKPETLADVSPNRLANRIKAPVFLAAGGEDERAPIEHSKKMEKALQDAGKQVESLYYETEGHGFYTQEHNREFYTRVLAFLARNIGGATAAPAGSAKPAK